MQMQMQMQMQTQMMQMMQMQMHMHNQMHWASSGKPSQAGSLRLAYP